MEKKSRAARRAAAAERILGAARRVLAFELGDPPPEIKALLRSMFTSPEAEGAVRTSSTSGTPTLPGRFRVRMRSSARPSW
ncbi:hypothetical protein ACSHWB_26355 [Lentzea sp. HUAS TT2]|uniref:hypothetical protein n=1 Tax=Lentzea sp. HUAS TT2 TaxID=3447454 RepID=UPI003F6EBAC2